jgi:hypothetical protein
MANGIVSALEPVSVRSSRAEYVGELIASGASQGEAEDSWSVFRGSDMYESDEYVVQLIKGGVGNLSHALATYTLVISRRDGQAVRDWRDIQEIKNRMVGRETEAVELYPSKARSFDFRDRTVLFCYVGSSGAERPDAAPHLPFGARERVVSIQSVLPHCKQRSVVVSSIQLEMNP